MKTLHGKFQEEPIESTLAAKRYNPATEFVFKLNKREHTITLSCGSNDDVDMFMEGGSLFVVSSNSGMGYLGIEVFNLEGEKYKQAHSFFFQDSQDFPEELKDWENLSANYIARIVAANYL